MKTRTKIYQVGSSVLLVTPDGESREFYSSGEYLRERRKPPYSDNSQVCDGLFHRGNTVRATPSNILAVIRREWRAGYKSRKESGEL